MAAKAGLDQALVRELSGHFPLRVGAAQDMMASGIWHIRPTVHMRRLSWSQLVSKESVLGQIVTGGKRYSGLRAPIPKTLSAAVGPTLPHSRPGAGHRGCVPSPASPQAVAGFITAVAPKFSPSTLRRRLGGIQRFTA